jgi:hypothetical protein
METKSSDEKEWTLIPRQSWLFVYVQLLLLLLLFIVGLLMLTATVAGSLIKT